MPGLRRTREEGRTRAAFLLSLSPLGDWLCDTYLAAPLICSKQPLQYTGRSFLGTNGTVASAPHCAQITVCISRGSRPARSRRRVERQAGHRWGSFINPFSAKNSCSPTVNTNSCPQSRQRRVLSVKLTSSCPPSCGYWCGHSLVTATSECGVPCRGTRTKVRRAATV